jgi:hypothetical protein
MSFKEIKELRQSGRLDEALQMANQNLEAEPANIWNKRAAAWVYYDYLKIHVQSASFEDFKENLLKIKDLVLPEDEKMVFDNCAWQIGSMLFTIQKTEHLDYGKINELSEIIKCFHFTRPSEAYSFLYKAFHKGYQNWSNYLTFADWWNFDNLRPEDFLKDEFKGKKVMSLAEQAYIAYSKKLLEGEPMDAYGQEKAIDKDKIQTFLPRLDAIISSYPAYQYPAYFKAKLLLALGDEENILATFLPFAKQKRNDFWVWELMANIFPDDKDIQLSCYCKALSLKTSEDFLVKLRQTFAGILVERQLYSEAKTEIQKVISTRESHDWQLPIQVTQWLEQDWFKSSPEKRDNKDFYNRFAKKAEELLYHDIPEEIIAIEFVNEDKNILNFVKNKQKVGFFNYAGLIVKPLAGELLKARINKEGENGFYRVLTVEKAENGESSPAIKNFCGPLKVIPPQNFGFIEDVFIEPKLIQNQNLITGQPVAGKAILSFNKKKNEFGWKAIYVGL